MRPSPVKEAVIHGPPDQPWLQGRYTWETDACWDAPSASDRFNSFLRAEIRRLVETYEGKSAPNIEVIVKLTPS